MPTDASGRFTFRQIQISEDTRLLLYIDNSPHKGVTVTLTGSKNFSDLHLYEDHLTIRKDHSKISFSNDHLSALYKDDPDILDIYTIDDDNHLKIAKGKYLFIPKNHAFTQTGPVTVGDQNISLLSKIQLNGTWQATNNWPLEVHGDFNITGTYQGTSNPIIIYRDLSIDAESFEGPYANLYLRKSTNPNLPNDYVYSVSLTNGGTLDLEKTRVHFEGGRRRIFRFGPFSPKTLTLHSLTLDVDDFEASSFQFLIKNTLIISGNTGKVDWKKMVVHGNINLLADKTLWRIPHHHCWHKGPISFWR